MGAPEPGPDGGGSARRGAVSGPRCKARRDTLWRWVNEFMVGCDKGQWQSYIACLGVSYCS